MTHIKTNVKLHGCCILTFDMIVMCPMCPSSKVENNVSRAKSKTSPSLGSVVNGYTTQHRCWGRQWFSQSQWVRKCQQQFQQIKYFFGLKPCCVKSVPELKYFLLIHKSCFVSVACVVVEVNIGSAGVHESTEAETKSSPFQFFGHKSHSAVST